MNSLAFKSLAAVATFASLTSLVGCSNDADSSSDEVGSATQHETAARGCVSYATARTNFDRDIKAAQDKLQADYDAAMAQHDAGVAQAKAERDAILGSLPQNPTSNETSDILNAAITDYNAKVGPGGPLDQAYQAAVAAAQATYHQNTQAATDTFNRTVCH